ncbi:4'-phosphopantetheinyl transferase superfamily protein [Streptomyces sp. NPDC046557]|uniref:4'-phosphopantetheinyl transferase family protein n=1 Tax=Streptomyces sp. NPDC046557 TaxID=3155372 RepID=UPI0033D5A2D1
MDLAIGEVTVWRVLVTPASSRAAEAARGILDDEESARAGAFRRDVDRALYLVAHVALRTVLGVVLDMPARKVVLGRAACPGCGGPHGRPRTLGGGPVEFSLSHTGGMALIALARDAVGVDVAQRATFDEARGLNIAARLHPAERAVLAELPSARTAAATLRCWVRKEAYLKATGIGLAAGADSVYVGPGPDHPVAPGAGPVPAEPVGWGFADVPVADRWAAAVALSLPNGVVSLRVRAGEFDLESGILSSY